MVTYYQYILTLFWFIVILTIYSLQSPLKDVRNKGYSYVPPEDMVGLILG